MDERHKKLLDDYGGDGFADSLGEALEMAKGAKTRLVVVPLAEEELQFLDLRVHEYQQREDDLCSGPPRRISRALLLQFLVRAYKEQTRY